MLEWTAFEDLCS